MPNTFSQSVQSKKIGFFEYCLGEGSLMKTFWGFLLLGSFFWMILFVLIANLFDGDKGSVSMDIGGIFLLVVLAIWFLWSFVFSFASIRAAFKQPNKMITFWVLLAVILYFTFLLFAAAFFIHLVLFQPIIP